MTTKHDLVDPTSGASFEVPNVFTPVEGHDGAGLVAAFEPWHHEAFRPNLVLGVETATPDRCTIEQHAARTVADDLALGLRVVSVGPPEIRGVLDGRVVVATYEAGGSLIIQQQYADVVGDRLVLLTMQYDAQMEDPFGVIFRHAVATLKVPTPGLAVTPDPATLPPMAPSGDHEDLSGVLAAVPSPDGPRLGADELAALTRGRRVKRVEADSPLVTGGFLDENGRLTELGDRVHLLLERAPRTITVERQRPGSAPEVLRIHQGGSDALVVAQDGASFSVQLAPLATTVMWILGWLGIGPVWPISFASGDTVTVPGAAFDARVSDPSVPVPDGADPTLAALWAEPWTPWVFSATHEPERTGFVTTPAAGTFVIGQDDRGTTLTTVPPYNQLVMMLRQTS